ncbi:tail fiber domain-containing protein, partial [Barnesiella intestinihominis]
MKTNRLFFVIAVYSFSFCVMGQMKIQNDGQISIGGYGSNSMGSSTLNLFPKNEKDPARISFYNSVSNTVNDVYIGRYITSENPSLFHLYGREGFCFSSSEGDVVLYDNANYGSMIQFLNVDVIGYFYSPSDSRFKKNIQPLNNTLSGLLRLSGISYQLNKETPAGTNNI